MAKFIVAAFLFSVLHCLGCDGDRPVAPSEPRPEGWQNIGLADKRINRLVLVDGWLYACANKDGLYRMPRPGSSNISWQFLALSDERVERGPFGITDMAAFNDTIIAGSRAGTDRFDIPGIFRSVDNGTAWVRADSGFIKDRVYPSASVVTRLAQATANPGLLASGCSGERLLYVSNDLGVSWQLKFELRGERDVYAVGFHPRSKNEIWVGGSGGDMPFLYRTLDFGESWDEILSPPYDPSAPVDAVVDIVFDPIQDGTIYICKRQVIMKTMDSGETWSTSDTLRSGLHSLSLNIFNGTELVAGAADSLYFSQDAGESWTVLQKTPEDPDTAMQTLAVDWQSRILYVAPFSVLSAVKGVYMLYF